MVANPPKKGTPKAPVAGWRERMNLSLVLSLSVGITVLVASLLAGFFALRVLYQNKMMDTWAIMFLELEHKGLILSDNLRDLLRTAGLPDGTLEIDTATQAVRVLSGGVSPHLQLSDLAIDAVSPGDVWPMVTVLELDGERFLATLTSSAGSDPQRVRVTLWRVKPSTFAGIFATEPTTGGSLYLVTREGRLIYTSSPEISGTNVAARPLVQKFIKSPLSQGQQEVTSDAGVALYGFFYEIPGSNVVMFYEVERDRIIATIYKISYQFLLILGGILATTLLLIQFPLRRITGPLREMALLAGRLGQGDFTVRIAREGFGELNILSRAFGTMTSNLLARDESIRRLLIEQGKKIRLEGELDIARNIQHNLLPTGKISKDSGLDLSAVYLPARECAGDWFSYTYNPHLQETIVVIVDVSGHGAGSSMFTSMIAGLFDQYRDLSSAPFPMAEFALKANRVLYRLGGQKWHATMMMLRFVAGTGKIQVLFAGHTPGILVPPADGARKSDNSVKIQKPSQPLGLAEEFPLVTDEYTFAKGSKILFFTDGLTEARNPYDKMWGTKPLREIFSHDRSHSAAQTVDVVINAWQGFRKGEAADDDACVVVMRAA